ncbi:MULTISPECIES: hypothetical protein [Stenotrophomonas maltophilia group]|uniref:hypothetical protein n=1 Tax=Stenotrophomonas maltophilia group TaxID=995085 RepID=UPI0015DFF009|nr:MULTISPECIES: hypothetical protein [Stenotrophomonas maltophilia group]MBA0398983.1 hypothetical protein [Stenotrophomonas maltophilia]MCU1134793.1 hypothetical protein [Stenotrophomonas maltophilia]HDS1550246.1 hypothetical protein [Stenotrophomonas maltophilia]
MLKILRGLGWALAGLLVLAIVVWCASRMWPVPESRLQAQQRLQARLPADGRNGFALLWTLAFDDLDPGQRDQALARDVQRWEADPRGKGARPQLAEDHVELRSRPSASCGPTASDCLAQVRADPQRFVDAHAGHQQLHARLDQLADADHFVSPFRPKGEGILVPMPTYGLVIDATSARALAYLQGDIDGALRGSCRGLQLGRRLVTGGSYLVESIIGASLVQANAQLLADMLVELPADQPLPAECEQAMKPMRAAEQSLCRAMQGEYAMSRAAIETSAQEFGGVLVLDRRSTLARVAGNLGWACGAAAMTALEADRPLPVPAPPQHDFGCLSNIMGCVLADIAGPAYPAYSSRPQDAAAMVRLIGAQRWLRQQAEDPVDALKRLPAQFRSQVRAPQLSADGRRLQVPRRSAPRSTGESPWLSVPMVAGDAPPAAARD